MLTFKIAYFFGKKYYKVTFFLKGKRQTKRFFEKDRALLFLWLAEKAGASPKIYKK